MDLPNGGGGTDMPRSLSLRNYEFLAKINGDLAVEGELSKLKRNRSFGDCPYELPEIDCDSESFLLGRALRRSPPSGNVLVTEVVPSHCTLQENFEDPHAWKIPIELFSAKKQQQTNHGKQTRRVRSYYNAQARLIDAYVNLEKSGYNNPDAKSCHSDTAYYSNALFYSRLTLLVNVSLLIAKLVASIVSGSMAVISSVVDSSLDLFSGVILWWASGAVKSRSLYAYPQGRTKLEPVAIVILSVVMALASVQVIRESVEKIIKLADDSTELPEVRAVTFCIMGSTILVKLILHLLCRRVNSHIVQALALDHRNDVVSNSIAIICGYLGSSDFSSVTSLDGFSYVDPIGAILISVYIIYNWWQTGYEQIKMLTGHTARPDFLSQLTWVSVNHHPKVKQVDTVRAFHFGCNFLVEVDIVLPSNMPLREAHDIGESLQHRLEYLPEVERAFVHLDYESTHHPHSEHKVV